MHRPAPLARRGSALGAGLVLCLGIAGTAPAAAAQCGQELVAGTTSPVDDFAESFDVEGQRVVVAAPRDDQLGVDSGAAYVYRQASSGPAGSGWELEQKLTAGDLPGGGFLTHAVVALEDPWLFAGSLWEVPPGGGSDRGVVRVYRRTGNHWQLHQKLWLAGAGPSTGFAGRIEVDEGVLFVSARGAQTLHLFRLQENQWVETQVLTDPEPTVGGDWLGVGLAAAHRRVATAVVRPGLGLVAYRFSPGSGAQTLFRIEDRVDLGGSAVHAGELALGVRDVAVQGFATAAGDASEVRVYHRQPNGESSVSNAWPPDGLKSEYGRALCFGGAADELLLVGTRAWVPPLGPLGAAYVYRRADQIWRVESEFRASPGYPQLRFGTSARHDGERFFLATQDQWGSSNAVSGRVFAFDPLPGPSLTVDDEEVSLQSGGSQRLSIQGCAESAGDLYLVLGSLSLAPDQACLPLDGHFLQLAIDPWFLASAQTPGQAPFLGTLGFLDPLARAQAEILIPPLADSPLVGSKLYHAALSIDLVQEVVSGTTVPSELLLSH